MPVVGDVLAARYRIDAVLGAGGMATVYRATDLRLEREVAVKVLLPNLARDPSLAERFDREARLLASVAHPCIAEVFDVDPGDPDAGREPFYVMELFDGGSVADRVAALGHLAPGELVPLIVAVAAGLGELHRQGLIHRDVKPANILFTGGRPKLADFGLARSDGRPELMVLTDPGTAMGTPAYMAPEVVAGARATTASDVYSLAATTFHALTGRAPHPAGTLTSLAATISEPVPAASSVAPTIGTALDAPLSAALAAEPADRPSLNAFTASLVAALDRAADPAAPPSAAAGAPAVSDSADAARASPVDPLEDTVRVPVGGPPTRVAKRPPAPPPTSSPARRARLRPGLAPAAILGLSAILGFTAVALAPFLPGVGSVPASEAPGSSEPPLASPSLVVTPSLAPTATPTSTPSPGLAALAAVDEVVAAIQRARGGPDGLGGGDARDLFDLAEEVRSHLEAGDFDEARSAAEQLEERADELSDEIDDERAEILLDAIEDLQDAIPA